MSEERALLPEGRYVGKGMDWVLGESLTGKIQVAVLVNLPEVDRQMAWYGFFTEDTIESTHKALRALGWTGDDYSDLTGIDRNEVSCVIGIENDQQGEPRNRIRWINPPMTAGILVKKQLTDAEKKAFGAKMKGKLLAQDRKLGPAAKGASSSAGGPGDPPPPGDDDVPSFMR